MNNVPPSGAAPVELVLLDPQASLDDGGPLLAIRRQTRRFVGGAHIGMWANRPASGVNFFRWAIVWAIFVQDREDTDVSIVTTGPGSILEGGVRRVLQMGMVASDVFIAGPGEVDDDGQTITDTKSIEWDIKAPLKLSNDELVVLSMQTTTALSPQNVLNLPVNAWNRTLLIT